MVQLFYTTLISVDLAQFEIFAISGSGDLNSFSIYDLKREFFLSFFFKYFYVYFFSFFFLFVLCFI